ncbi:Fur family transcriptional regulator [[Clostridium] polysaccharolyticum]|jgi:Fur family peroxide stress response transcriptional regulator|uniref:Fur family transcriptional regulator, peroxide stress response regulator n=1 Tax=[Clostridium] polysaccharolyticum TaxID=29364 RepID=A0A1I0FP67_9FIRM|nr:transcriptional repressor [[Clostridium] polysaccharolyticum]SET60225.1 Fur family transcriptional regulator, peroxide stress response regulator [[Clostridium] polysaccharolyticum]
MSTIKYSKQREAIKTYLQHSSSHPTAAKVYEDLRVEYPNISLGTVYRNLNFLVEQSEIVKISFDDGSDHYDGNITPHYHFICKKCGQVTDIAVPSLDHINVLASANFEGSIKGHVTYFYGVCKDCLAH